MSETSVYDELRPLLFSIAYRMLGSVGDAEDVVQEAFVRYSREPGVESPRAWLTAVTTRLAIDQLRSARARRDQYVGQWLPEPLVVEPEPGPPDVVETADTLSLAFLVVLETLSPVERAVFLLHDVFDYGYDEIADIVGKSQENCRQIAVRARRHVDGRRPRFEASAQKRAELAERFFAAAEGGDVDSLVELLAEDAVMVGDGGGRAPAALEPIRGRERIAAAFAGWAKQGLEAGLRVRGAVVNGDPGVVAYDADDHVVAVISVDVADGLVRTVRSVLNPEKLGHLGPVGDLRAVFRSRRSP